MINSLQERICYFENWLVTGRRILWLFGNFLVRYFCNVYHATGSLVDYENTPR